MKGCREKQPHLKFAGVSCKFLIVRIVGVSRNISTWRDLRNVNKDLYVIQKKMSLSWWDNLGPLTSLDNNGG